ncbi:MAG TPA: radical SAM family heme chaperone HemW [Pyrinomonadaceae bacterium]
MTPAGVYIHIPFCRSRCSYCDFATGLYQSELAAQYVDAVVTEIESNTVAHSGLDVDTIYLGGGTPSLLSAGQLQMILDAVCAHFRVAEQAEVTMEMNPGTLSAEVLSAFRAAGVNRASFGAQTFNDAELARLGRSHNVGDILKTFSDLRVAGFENLSFDLIAGLPGQQLDRWQSNVEKALELRPEHLSFYLLEVHPGTPLAEHIRRGIQPTPDDDLAAVMYEWMLERAVGAGYEHYEISNLCLPGFASRHNVKYWTGTPYFGFGCSAHSYDGQGRRWSNERDINKYMKAIEDGVSAVVQEQQLSDMEIRSEAIFLGMRMMRGVDTKRYRDSFGIDLCETYKGDFSRFVDAGLVEFEGDVVRLTRAGALMSNEVFAAFV